MWVNISKTLQDVGRLRVLVVGGSETAGVNCDDGETRHKACSWPARLGRWLESPGFRVEVDNQASGGTTISASFPSLGILLSNVPDIFIVDFVVNDAFETQDSGASLLSAYEAFIIRNPWLEPINSRSRGDQVWRRITTQKRTELYTLCGNAGSVSPLPDTAVGRLIRAAQSSQ